jgi:hypothetical protein
MAAAVPCFARVRSGGRFSLLTFLSVLTGMDGERVGKKAGGPTASTTRHYFSAYLALGSSASFQFLVL